MNTKTATPSPLQAGGSERGQALPETDSSQTPPATWKLVLAFATIYLVWSSTYLGIRYAIETIPPFLMAAARFLAAGVVLYGFERLRGAAAPTRGEWRDATIVGSLLLAIGNGGVTWAELVIPSGTAALLVALIPLWIVLLDWLRPHGVRPRPLVFVGLAVGFLGVALLARGDGTAGGPAHVWGVVALIGASIGWSIGSLFNRSARRPRSAMLGIALPMITGGALLLLAALVRGEAAQFVFARLTTVSVLAWLYLTVVGTLGFTAYVWLLQVSTPARVSTYAYVNPLLALMLGCTIGGERFSNQLFVAGAMIIVAVVLIVRSGSRTRESEKVGK